MAAVSEYLKVEGMGSTRDLALGHADKQAEQYFGHGAEWVREINGAEAIATNMDGSAAAWCIRVEYRPKD